MLSPKLAVETSDDDLKTGMKRIEGSLGKMIAKDIQKGKLTEADGKKTVNEVMSRFTTTTNIKDAKDCD
jgi:3-hydroxyacyl-CoA dehydrogenase